VHGWCDSRVVNRAELAERRKGPCIVEEYDSTCVVPPGAIASLDRYGNIAIDVPVGTDSCSDASNDSVSV
jgi:N-methylhydantoinase A